MTQDKNRLKSIKRIKQTADVDMEEPNRLVNIKEKNMRVNEV